ncbi:MAG: 50S ribosome-binding GTPase, partial [Clostridia bacterium]|nr:50S ribosome-binding GTPase [Clostridia bacterium]
EEVSRERVKSALTEVIGSIDALLSTFRAGSRVAHGVKVAICGKPNVGKSSLLNALLNYDKAIVSETAGTTRDVVEGVRDINGVRFNLYDTAGIRDAKDGIENMGVRLSEKTVKTSDLAVFVLSAVGADAEDEKVYALIKEMPHITIVNKTDCGVYKDDRAELYVSAKTGAGLDALRNEIYDRTIGKVDLNGDFLCEERHYGALKNAAEKLSAALAAVYYTPLDILSVDILAGWQYLGEISGKTASEDIIDDIFSRFCVGK